MVETRHLNLLLHQDLIEGAGGRWMLSGQNLANVYYHFLMNIICKFINELLPKATVMETSPSTEDEVHSMQANVGREDPAMAFPRRRRLSRSWR